MLNWNYKKISDQYLPRQFEYHPSNNNILFGCVTGECLIVNPDNNQITSLGNFGRMENDVILGLCWLRNRTNLFICGSGDGNVTLNTSDAYDSFNARDSSTIGKANPSIIRTFERFKELTSVHVNCSDEWILLSGYTPKCDVLDLETGSLIRSFENIHRDHINISRFTHTSPSVFATCSFDETVKLWDMRVHQKTGGGVQKSIYSVKCDKGEWLFDILIICLLIFSV